MPRKEPLDKREIEICHRLKEFRREVSGLSRIVFAQKVGLDSSIIVRYEHARVALKYAHAWRLIRSYYISPEWLATGKGGKWDRVAGITPSPESLNLSGNVLFSKVFDRYLATEIASIKEGQTATIETPNADEMRVRHEYGFNKQLRDWLTEIPQDQMHSFVEMLRKAGISIFSETPKENPHVISQRKERLMEDLNMDVKIRLYGYSGWVPEKNDAGSILGDKDCLTVSSEFRNTLPDMKLARTMKQLLEDVRRLAKPAGMKAQLAKYLEVPQARVSEWLGDKYEPSGEITLKLLQWVEQQERQK